jgi:uncharacterized membrane protein YdjX (TVP38/TMEM64 family)
MIRPARGADEALASRARSRLVVGAALITGIVVVASSSPLHAAISELVARLAAVLDAEPVLGMAFFLLFAAGSALFAFFSSALLVPVALHHWGWPATLALLWLGWLIGGLIAYALGRSLGSWMARALVSPGRLERYRDRLGAARSLPALIAFQLAVPSELTGWVMGSIGIPLARFLLVFALGELPFAAGAVFLGEGFLQRRYGLMLGVGALGVAFAVWSVWRWRRVAPRPGTPIAWSRDHEQARSRGEGPHDHEQPGGPHRERLPRARRRGDAFGGHTPPSHRGRRGPRHRHDLEP